MSEKHDRITRKLTNAGGGWAERSDKYLCEDHTCCGGKQPAYHVRPPWWYPHKEDIERFESLDEIEAWLSGGDLVTSAQAAKELGITPRWVRELIKRGELHGNAVTTRLLLITRQSLDAYKARQAAQEGRQDGSA